MSLKGHSRSTTNFPLHGDCGYITSLLHSEVLVENRGVSAPHHVKDGQIDKVRAMHVRRAVKTEILNLDIETKVLYEPDEHSRCPVVSTFQQKTFRHRLASLQLARLYTRVDRLLSHQPVRRPFTP